MMWDGSKPVDLLLSSLCKQLVLHPGRTSNR